MVGDMPIINWAGVGYLDYTVESAAKNSDVNAIKNQKRKYACQSWDLTTGGPTPEKMKTLEIDQLIS